MRLFDLYFEEDCPYFDETSKYLEIDGIGKMRILSREKGVAACTEELGEYLSHKGLKVSYVRSGRLFEPREIFSVEGDLEKLFLFWRVSQTFLSITCAIATKTRELVEKSRAVNSMVVVAATRKTHPGMRYFEIKAVIAGGGVIHRNSLSDSILITPNHLRVLGIGTSPSIRIKFEDLLNRIRRCCIRHIEVEPPTDPEKYAKADLILLDHYSIEELKQIVPKIKKKNPNLKVAVAGNIEDDISNYAKYADVIVTSAPYYARPLDLTCKIDRL